MDDLTELAGHFDRSRGRLRAVAFRMLGSLDEADDAVQETWLRAARDGAAGVANVPGWLTTITGRICLDLLRARRRRGEEFTDPAELGPVAAGADPAEEAVLAESVGLALLVVLDRLGPAERVAFVLHDLFAVPFEEIAPIVGRTPVAAKKLASRARQRVRGQAAVPAADLARQREVVTAFLAAARAGDLDGLLAVLAPGVVRRADHAARHRVARAEIRGARAVAEETRVNSGLARFAVPALVDGAVGAVVAPRGRLRYVLRTAIDGDRITAIEVIGERDRLRGLRLAVLPERSRCGLSGAV